MIQRDKELANGNPNVAAEILVQKAILQEAKNEKLTEEEQYNLDLAKQEVEVNFYLQKKFDKDFSNVSAVSEEEAKKVLERAIDELKLSVRAYDKILKVSRTIADLENSENIEVVHLLEALNYRKKY